MNRSALPKISCRNVWKIFGPQPTQTLAQVQDATHSKESVLAQSGHVLAVRNVSFEVYPRETFVVMGLSGSGKSTLLRCLPRLIEPTSGQITIDGEDIGAANMRRLRAIRRHKMSMVFQHFGLFAHRRVIDNVAYGLEVQGIDKAARYRRSAQVLEMVNLRGWEESYPDQLSGGMQQRVGLARALAVDPEIMLFDEPFSALDPLIRRDMQDELCRLQDQIHKTIIFITHDFTEALRMGDRIAIMKDGELVQVGAPEQVMLHPATDYVREFTKDAPRALVLTARSIMTPINGQPLATERAIPATATLNSLIPLVAASDVPLPVIDETQAIIGSVDRTAVMLALAGA